MRRLSRLDTVAILWTALVTIIPVVFGILLLRDPAPIVTASTTTTDVFHAIAYRNFALSAVLVFALVSQPRRVIAVLLAARGLTALADGISGVFGTGGIAAIAPYIGAVGDLGFAVIMLNREHLADR